MIVPALNIEIKPTDDRKINDQVFVNNTCFKMYDFFLVFFKNYDTISSRGLFNAASWLVSSGHKTIISKSSEMAGAVMSNIFKRSGVGVIPYIAKSIVYEESDVYRK